MPPAARYPRGCGCSQTALHHATTVPEVLEAQALCTTLPLGAPEEEHEEEFGGIHELELPDKVVEVGGWIYATTIHLPPSVAEIQASQTTSQQLTPSWGPLEQAAFNDLKHAVILGPVLLIPDKNSSFWVEADSSNFAIGAVLSQQSPEDGKWHPVVLYSKNLNAVEQNYKIHDKEMLAIIQLFEEW
ncbi:hypothetical protein E4T56_gene3387 [Termitomyces sp. T112]|nr:hypothetical protein E4T56_gene3387 [Termitomyces sp. T112]